MKYKLVVVVDVPSEESAETLLANVKDAVTDVLDYEKEDMVASYIEKE